MKMLTDYSAGHVTVEARKDVSIDGTRLLSGAFTAETYDDTAENAYLLAGELGRLFHDCRTAEAWGLGAAGDWEKRGGYLHPWTPEKIIDVDAELAKREEQKRLAA